MLKVEIQHHHIRIWHLAAPELSSSIKFQLYSTYDFSSYHQGKLLIFNFMTLKTFRLSSRKKRVCPVLKILVDRDTDQQNDAILWYIYTWWTYKHHTSFNTRYQGFPCYIRILANMPQNKRTWIISSLILGVMIHTKWTIISHVILIFCSIVAA